MASRGMVSLLVFACIACGACKSRQEEFREQQAEMERDKARAYASSAASEQALYERRERELAAEKARLDQEQLIDTARSNVSDLAQAILAAEQNGGADAGLQVLEQRRAAVADVLTRAREARAQLVEFDAGEFPSGSQRAPGFQLAIEQLDGLSKAEADMVCHPSSTSRGTPARAAADAKVCDEFRALLGLADSGRTQP